MSGLRSEEAETLDAILVALWQCETAPGFERMAAKVHAAVERIVAARVASAAAEAWDKGRAVGRADDPRVRAEPNPYRAVLAAAHDEGSEQQGSMAPQANEAGSQSDSGADVGGNATHVIRGAQRGDSA